VRTWPGPGAASRTSSGQADLQPTVAGQRRAVNQEFFGIARGAAAIHPLAGTDDRYGMTATPQSVDEPRQGHRHPVDLGRVRFADDTHPASGTRGGTRSDLEPCVGCTAPGVVSVD